MTTTRREWIKGFLAAASLMAMGGPALAQAGFPPPAPGQAPPGFGDPTRQHFDTLRQQENERRSFDALQRSQQRETERNLETLRRQQADQRRALDVMRREGREADAARTGQRLQVQGRRPRRSLSPEERSRIERATRSSPSSPTPSIIVEDPPRRQHRRRTGS
ncbi:hypothetical protein ACJ4V0_06915 [Phreatobacter sp. HK31-P]